VRFNNPIAPPSHAQPNKKAAGKPAAQSFKIFGQQIPEFRSGASVEPRHLFSELSNSEIH
jgi:hypothetical protein